MPQASPQRRLLARLARPCWNTWSGPGTGPYRRVRTCLGTDAVDWIWNGDKSARKRWSMYALRRRQGLSAPDQDIRPVLPDAVLRRFWRHFEVFIEAEI